MNSHLMASAALATVLALSASTASAAKSPQDFIKDAIQGDNSEIALGQLAQQKASNPQVKQFGQMLVTDHTQAKNEATTVAKSLNVTPPESPTQEAQDEQAKLSKMSGVDFDKEFANYMVTDHQKDISEFQEEANAKSGPASDLAAKQLPVLQKHLEMAKTAAANDQSNATASSANPATHGPQDAANDWRASKLIGVAVYGPDNKKVGSISDVMMSKDGKAQLVVVGVGGFLGMGEKDVAVPFEQIKFTDQPLATTANSGNGMATGNAEGRAATDDTKDAAPLATKPVMSDHKNDYPDHGVIEMTAAQLKSAPTFKFTN